MPLNHVISSSGLADLILISTSDSIKRKTLKRGILNFVSTVLSYICILYLIHLLTFLSSETYKQNKLKFPTSACWNGRGMILCAVTLVFLCVGCQKGELKVGPPKVQQSVQSIWTTKKWQYHKRLMHKMAALLFFALPGIRMRNVFFTQLNRIYNFVSLYYFLEKKGDRLRYHIV